MTNRKEKIRIWDPFVRLFHWLLLASYAVSFLTQEQAYELHLQAGYTVAGLVVLRTVWGFVGPRHARFSDFVYGLTHVLFDLKEIIRKRPRRYLGHTPAGGVMIIALLLCLTGISVSGVALDAAENRAGPLADTMLFLYTDQIAHVHVLLTDVSIVLIIIHILGIATMSLIHRENLVTTMVTGRKRPE